MMWLVFVITLTIVVPVVIGMSIAETIKDGRRWHDVEIYREQPDGTLKKER